MFSSDKGDTEAAASFAATGRALWHEARSLGQRVIKLESLVDGFDLSGCASATGEWRD